MTWINIPEGTFCPVCEIRPATKVWSDSPFSAVHGAFEYICEMCTLERQLEHAEEAARRIRACEEAHSMMWLPSKPQQFLFTDPPAPNYISPASKLLRPSSNLGLVKE